MRPEEEGDFDPYAGEEGETRSAVRRAWEGFEARREALIPILQKVQAALGYISMPAMEETADFLSIPVGEVYGVVTFYHQFRLTPPGKYQIKVCMGTACHVKRSYVIHEEWKRRLGIEDGQTTGDRLFSLEKVACVGCCALAPVMVMSTDGKETFYGHAMTSKVNGLILEVRRKEMGDPDA
jgi:NADH-quinone oxidoreductase subunit E